jgi:hypothetical protein
VAIVAGFEVACRVAAALQPEARNARGFHTTGTTGALWCGRGRGDAPRIGCPSAKRRTRHSVQPSRRPA